MVNRTAQRETVIGVFNDQMTAQRAIERLKDAGFAPNDIGILMQNQQGAQAPAPPLGADDQAAQLLRARKAA